MLKIIRGATCAQNTEKSIAHNAVTLITEIMSRNCLKETDVSAIFFTATADLNAANPATAVRAQLNLHQVAFMCAQEMSVAGALPRCLRVALFAQIPDDTAVTPVYLGNAATLRPDLH